MNTDSYIEEIRAKHIGFKKFALGLLAAVIFFSGVTIGLVLPNTSLTQKLGLTTELSSANKVNDLFTDNLFSTDQNLSKTPGFSVFWDVWNEIETKYVN